MNAIDFHKKLDNGEYAKELKDACRSKKSLTFEDGKFTQSTNLTPVNIQPRNQLAEGME